MPTLMNTFARDDSGRVGFMTSAQATANTNIMANTLNVTTGVSTSSSQQPVRYQVFINYFTTTSQPRKLPEYEGTRGALTEMLGLAGDGPWTINRNVYDASNLVLDQLNAHCLPEPKIMSHGPKSIVLTWENETTTLYMTVSAKSLSVLLSNKDRIIERRKVELPLVNASRSSSFPISGPLLPTR